MYNYNAIVIRVIDGDTFDADVDLGFHTISRQRFRVAGYSAPEIKGTEREIGLIAKAKLEELLPLGKYITLTSTKTEKFSRWLGEVILADGTTLSSYLISNGYGWPWNGKGKRPLFDPSAGYPFPPKPALEGL